MNILRPQFLCQICQQRFTRFNGFQLAPMHVKRGKRARSRTLAGHLDYSAQHCRSLTSTDGLWRVSTSVPFIKGESPSEGHMIYISALSIPAPMPDPIDW